MSDLAPALNIKILFKSYLAFYTLADLFLESYTDRLLLDFLGYVTLFKRGNNFIKLHTINMRVRQEMLVFSLLLLVSVGYSFSLRHVMDRLNALEMKFEIENRLRRSETEECFRRIFEINTGNKMATAHEIVPPVDMTHSQHENAVLSSTDSNKTSKETFDYQSLKSYLINGVRDEKQVNIKFRNELENVVKKLKTDNSMFENVIKEEMRNFTEKVTENQKSLVSAERFDNYSETVMKQSDKKIDDVRKSLISLNSDMETSIQNINNELSKLNQSLIQERNAIQSCKILQNSQFSGVYYMRNIIIATGFSVFCDQLTDGGGWIVIQRRLDGSVDFERTWADYKTGFGDLNGEFWLGNDKIHALTAAGFKELRIDMEDFEGNRAYAKYNKFHVKSESDNYALEVSGYSGNAGDSLNDHNGSQFSTKDRDNDPRYDSCSKNFRGAWWYYSGCLISNLNGYYFGAYCPHGQGVVWFNWKYSWTDALKFVEMKIR